MSWFCAEHGLTLWFSGRSGADRLFLLGLKDCEVRTTALEYPLPIFREGPSRTYSWQVCLGLLVKADMVEHTEGVVGIECEAGLKKSLKWSLSKRSLDQ